MQVQLSLVDDLLFEKVHLQFDSTHFVKTHERKYTSMKAYIYI